MAESPRNINIDVNAHFDRMREIVRDTVGLHLIAAEVLDEIGEAREKHGDQTYLPLGFGPDEGALSQTFNDPGVGACLYDADTNASLEKLAKARCDWNSKNGTVTWEHVVTEEWAELLAASTSAEARREALQLAAMAVSIVAAIDAQEALK